MENFLEKFEQDVANNPPTPKQNYVIEHGAVFTYSKRELLEKMKSIDTMSDTELYNLISSEYHIIFSYIFDSQNEDEYNYDFLLQSTRFITILNQVVAAKEIEYEDKIHLNSFIYNYLIYTEYNKDNEYIRHTLFMLAETLNKKDVNRLLGCELDARLCIFLALSLNSTFDQHEKIRRLNFTLATALPTIMTVQKVIDIYESIFTSVTDLIVATIFDIDIASNKDKDWVTTEVMTADINITKAVLLIMESLTPYDLSIVLQTISYNFKWKNCAEGISKVSFDSLDPNIFVKTNIILQQLEGEGFVFP